MNVEKVLKEECGDYLKRYSTAEHQQLIITYWDTVRFTRKTGTISANIIKTELAYWEKFDIDVVIRALRAHLSQRREYKESYTRGIMRNMQEKKKGKKAPKEKGRSTADNFNAPPRDLNFLIE